jgi:uncharacterized integral membrane protein
MKIKNINSSLIFFAVVFVLFFISHNSAQALTISPARIEISGDPGTTITKQITLFNDSKAGEETYYVSYANFEAQGETGSPLFVEPKGDLGTWMNAGQSVTLKANESKTIILTINIPVGAYSGGHFAVVFFGNKPDEAGQVSVGAKTGTLVLLSVNGDVLEAGGLASFNTKNNKFFYNTLPVGLEYRWKNDGNDRVKPEGEITIRNLFYIPAARINANAVSGNILPHSTRLFNIEWLKYKADTNEAPGGSFINQFFKRASYQWKNFAVGPYMAHLDLYYGAQNTNHSSKNVFFFVFPWQLLVIIFIVLAVVIFIGKKLLKRYNKNIIEKARLGMNTPSEANHV